MYSPPTNISTNTDRLLQIVNAKHSLSLVGYEQLFHWSCDHIDSFWSLVWDFALPVIGTKDNRHLPQSAPSSDHHLLQQHPVVNPDLTPDQNPPWFPYARLNWAENILRHAHSRPDHTALVHAAEPLPSQARSLSDHFRSITYSDLYSLVANLVSALLSVPVSPGDRVAAYCSNSIENCAALLATVAIGAIWVGCASDFGPDGVLERLEQVQPKVLFVVDAVAYNGKVHHHNAKLATLLSGLKEKQLLPPKVVLIQSGLSRDDMHFSADPMLRDYKLTPWNDFVELGRANGLGKNEDGQIEWCRMPFDWPLWILFSSGTTGKPKAIVHRAGGMLLQSKKELVICADISHEDVFFYYTTTGWMMYNFLVAGLQTGCTLVLYDGSPLKDPALLWRWVDELKISIFGTSAKYLDALSRVYKPRTFHSLSTLKHIYSTGSPLSPALFDYVHDYIKPDVLLASITGGTDICSLFAGMNTSLPVYRGEIQCRMLGMAVETFSAGGSVIPPGLSGELVCTKPFPCQPLGFWPLPGYGEEEEVLKAQARHHQSYFSQLPGVWYHGDHVIITPSRSNNGGGIIMLGRSDGVLNPGGVRFGTAELYEVIENSFSESTAAKPQLVISDCIAVGQSIRNNTDERVILFVVLPEGHTITNELESAIKTEIRKKRTARHVPSKIIQVEDIPQTLNGKRVEIPIKKIINGASITSINPATLKNPNCLASFALIGVQLRQEIN